MENKNILFVSAQKAYYPTSGVESRINNLVKIFGKKNKLFIFAPFQEKISAKNYFGLDYGNKFRKLYDARIIRKARELNQKNKIDIIYATTLWSGFNGYLLKRKLGAKFYFDNHNVEFLRYKRTKSFIWPAVFLFERFICKKADKVVCVSEKDKEYMIKYFGLNSKKIDVIENPVDTTIFYSNTKVRNKIRKEFGLKKNEKFILFFGQLDYTPNVEALKIISEEIIPRLDKSKSSYKIIVCGKGDGNGFLKKYQNKNLIFKGFVDKIQDYINASDVVIAPLKSGSGTRIKILEALACKKKVISTSIGAEGIRNNKYLEVQDDWEKFVEQI